MSVPYSPPLIGMLKAAFRSEFSIDTEKETTNIMAIIGSMIDLF